MIAADPLDDRRADQATVMIIALRRILTHWSNRKRTGVATIRFIDMPDTVGSIAFATSDGVTVGKIRPPVGSITFAGGQLVIVGVGTSVDADCQ